MSTIEYFRPYLTEIQPESFIEVTKEDLLYEQMMAEREAIEEGLRIRKFTDPFLERATIQRKVAMELLSRNTILLHGSTVAVDGGAYLFTAPCGTGKSTHTRFWREVFCDRAVMVNDDKAFLHITPSGVIAYGSPWCGKHGLGLNVSFPLNGICFLRRGVKNTIQLADPCECFDELCHQTMIPDEPHLRETALSIAENLVQMIPLWSMECTKDPSAAYVSYNAMSSFGMD